MGELFGSRSFNVLVTVCTVVIMLCGAVIFYASNRGNSPEPATAASATSPEAEDEDEAVPSPPPNRTPSHGKTEPSRGTLTKTRTPSPAADPVPAVDEPVAAPAIASPWAPAPSSEPAPQSQPQPPEQVAQPETEPEVVCPTGHLSVSLDEARLGPYDGFLTRRPVIISGTVRNDSSAEVDVSLNSAVRVVGIDSDGEVDRSYWLNLEYAPPPGTLKPSFISLPPGTTLSFDHEEVELHTDWSITKYWGVDPEYTLAYSSFTDYQPYPCDDVARVEIMSDPIPNRP